MFSRLSPCHLFWSVPAIAVVLLVACGETPTAPTSPAPSSSSAASSGAPVPSPTPAPAGSGTLSVKITDSPFSEAEALLITFSGLSAHIGDEDGEGDGDGEWVTLPFAGGTGRLTCDLKKLVDAQDLLGSGQLTAGHYTQLRLTVSAATIYFDTATTNTTACAPTMTLESDEETGTPVEVPSGTVKLVRQFEVKASTSTSILLDFDGDKSVHQTGNGRYKLQPVIKILSVQ